MNIDERLTGNQSKPDKNRSGGINQEMINPLNRGYPRFLKYVIRIDSTMQSRVHAKGHHAPQSIAMLREQLRQCVLVTVRDAFNEFCFRRGVRHYSGHPQPRQRTANIPVSFVHATDDRKKSPEAIMRHPVLLADLHLFECCDFDHVAFLLLRESCPLNADLLTKVRLQTDIARCPEISQYFTLR